MAPIFWAGVGIFATGVTLQWLIGSRPLDIVILAAIFVWWALLLSGVGS